LSDSKSFVALVVIGIAMIFALVFLPSHASDNIIIIRDSKDTESPCDFMVYKSSSFTIGENCHTNSIVYNSTDSSTVINQSINNTSSGHLVFVKKGTYVLNTPINLQHGLTLMGESPSQNVIGGSVGTAFKVNANKNINALQYNRTQLAYFITVKNIFLDGNKNNNTLGNGVYLNNFTNDVYFENMYVDGFSEHGLKFDNTWNYKIIGVTSEHNDLDGLKVRDGNDIYIVASKFLSNGQYGISIGESSKSVINAMVSTNYIALNSKHGVVVTDSPNGVYMGNQFEGNGQLTTNTYDAIRFENDCDNSKVIGNSFIGGGKTRFAVAIGSSNSAGIIIMGNTMSTQQTNPISNSGTNTRITRNVGFTTENSGTATITTLATTVNVNHGLSYTPSINDINITPQGNWGMCVNWWISGITSTQFVINCSVAPGANLSFSWSVWRNV
jgi:hypothetical protein